MEYSYHIHSYDDISRDDQWCKEATATMFMFEIQTKFTVRRKLDDKDDGEAYDCEVLESEPLSKSPDDQHGDFKRRLYRGFHHIIYRLNEYSMPDDQIQSLFDDSYEHIQSADPIVPFVPFFVHINVCTVLLEGETIEDAMDRLVRPDHLMPLRLVRSILGKEDMPTCPAGGRLRIFLLYGLPRIRVEDAGKGFEPMDVCPICLGGPTAGAPVSFLPCRHAFHTHCIVRWLMEKDHPWCPLCRHQIVLDGGGQPKELGCYLQTND